jgi:predicted GNAT family N-acyltransferase
MPVTRQKTSETGFRVVDADWTQHAADIRRIRHTVFVLGQAIPDRLEWDGRDAHCCHALGLLDDGRAVATGRLQDDGRIGRMAVLEDWRGQGIGRAILEHLLGLARRQQLSDVYLHAQADSTGFYRQSGFTDCGKSFMEAGIPHIEMRRRLA